MYDQLVAETSEERFDERRVLLLKGQVLQLERQVGKDVAMLSCTHRKTEASIMY